MADSTNSAWGGRFQQAPSTLTCRYTESWPFDRKLYETDIAGSIAHAKMLSKQGIITQAEADNIVKGLEKIRKEISDGKFIWKPELEDVHMNIEARLIELIGETGKKLHTGRSRNDQISLDFRLYILKSLANWKKLIINLCKTLADLAQRNIKVILPGYTHLQPAQPILLGHHFMAYAAMFKRDLQRILDCEMRTGTSPLGAAALAGPTYNLDPAYTAKELGLARIFDNSLDAVSDRDFVLEAQFVASVCMMHLSRLAEELIIWANPGFGFIGLPDEFSTGSSIMPQKKNPDVPELVRGKCGRVYGNLMALLTTMKGLPLAYNKDLQEDKEGFFDTDATLSSSLEIMAAMLPRLQINADNMLEACKKGFLNATDLADYLTRKNIPFREAHKITGQAVRLAESEGKGLEELTLEQYASITDLVEPDIYQFLDYEACVCRREIPGATGPESVKKQIANLKAWLANYHES